MSCKTELIEPIVINLTKVYFGILLKVDDFCLGKTIKSNKNKH